MAGCACKNATTVNVEGKKSLMGSAIELVMKQTCKCRGYVEKYIFGQDETFYIRVEINDIFLKEDNVP